VDTNCDPEEIDFPIPSNDDAIRAIALMAGVISRACAEGLKMRKEPEAEGRKSRARKAEPEEAPVAARAEPVEAAEPTVAAPATPATAPSAAEQQPGAPA